jgi:hypothetical protein
MKSNQEGRIHGESLLDDSDESVKVGIPPFSDATPLFEFELHVDEELSEPLSVIARSSSLLMDSTLYFRLHIFLAGRTFRMATLKLDGRAVGFVVLLYIIL